MVREDLPPSMGSKSAIAREIKKLFPDQFRRVSVEQLIGLGLQCVVVDVSTLVRTYLTPHLVTSTSGMLDSIVSPETVRGSDIGNIIHRFVYPFFTAGFDKALVALDTPIPFPARTLTRISRISKSEHPDDYETRIAELRETLTFCFDALSANNYQAVLTRSIHIDILSLISFEATKADVQQLVLLCTIARFQHQPPPSGSKIIIMGLIRREWLRMSELSLRERTEAVIKEIEKRSWGAAVLVDGSVEVSTAPLSPWCLRGAGVLPNEATFDAARNVYTLSPEALCRMFFQEAMFVNGQVAANGVFQVLRTPGVNDWAIEGDHLVPSIFLSGWASHPNVQIDPTATLWVTGGDTDCLIFALVYVVLGMWPGCRLSVTAMGGREGWSKTGMLQIVDDLGVLAPDAVVYATSMLAGCDYCVGIHNLAHGTYMKDVHMSLMRWRRGQVAGTGAILWDTQQLVSFHKSGKVRVNRDTFKDWFSAVLATSKLPPPDRVPTDEVLRTHHGQLQWFLRYAVHGWKGPAFHRETPYPGLHQRVCAASKRKVFALDGPYGDTMMRMYATLAESVPRILIKIDAAGELTSMPPPV